MKTQVVDLEALVCGSSSSSDRRITRETLVPDQDHDDEGDAAPPPPQPHNLDYAPDSFWVSRDAEFDWFDRNAFFDRKGSTKGTDFANSSAHSSRRFSMNLTKSKAATSIFGLPTSQKSYIADANTRRNHHHYNHHHHMFPGRREGSGKTTTLLNEPSSPKVSCIGRVRSKRDRNRRLKNRKTSSVSGSASVKAEGSSSKRKKKQKNRGKQSGSDEPEEVKTESRTRKGKGLWKNLRAMFRSHGKKNLNKSNKTSAHGDGKSVTRDGLKEEPTDVRGGVTMVVPSLGGMTRFVSGRRSTSWVGDAEWQHERSGPLDKEPVWKRRDVDPPQNVLCSRDWEAEGPASV